MPTSEVFNIDCMEGMAQYPDKYFELAIVDPPYGIDVNKMTLGGGNTNLIKHGIRLLLLKNILINYLEYPKIK